MQVIPGVLSNCAWLVKFKSPVDVGTVLEKNLMCMCVLKKERCSKHLYKGGMLLTMPLQILLVNVEGAVSCTLSCSPQS